MALCCPQTPHCAQNSARWLKSDRDGSPGLAGKIVILGLDNSDGISVIMTRESFLDHKVGV